MIKRFLKLLNDLRINSYRWIEYQYLSGKLKLFAFVLALVIYFLIYALSFALLILRGLNVL